MSVSSSSVYGCQLWGTSSKVSSRPVSALESRKSNAIKCELPATTRLHASHNSPSKPNRPISSKSTRPPSTKKKNYSAIDKQTCNYDESVASGGDCQRMSDSRYEEVLAYRESRPKADRQASDVTTPNEPGTVDCVDKSPEFLVKFEKQMASVSDSWFRFVCNVINVLSQEKAVRKIVLHPDPTRIPRDEVYKIIGEVSTEDNCLEVELQYLEKRLFKATTVVTHNSKALWKEFEELKDKHFRLKNTQDRSHADLKRELDILNEENKRLDNKYNEALELYNQERAKCEAQEKHKIFISRDITELKNKMKYFEGKSSEWKGRLDKQEKECLSLDKAVRNESAIRDRENKQHKETYYRYEELLKVNGRLNSELVRQEEDLVALTAKNVKLKQELNNLRTTVSECVMKEEELLSEISKKNAKITTLESDRNQTNVTESTEMSDSQIVEIQQRNDPVQDLTTKLKEMESELKEKVRKEECLTKELDDLRQRECSPESGLSMKAEITKLQSAVKDLTDDKGELERIVAQKTLELDQRNLMVQQRSQILHAREELIPMIRDKQKRLLDCADRLQSIFGDSGHTEGEQDDEFNQQKMAADYTLLEQKQLEILQLERRLRKLQRRGEEKKEDDATEGKKWSFSIF